MCSPSSDSESRSQWALESAWMYLILPVYHMILYADDLLLFLYFPLSLASLIPEFSFTMCYIIKGDFCSHSSAKLGLPNAWEEGSMYNHLAALLSAVLATMLSRRFDCRDQKRN